MRQRAGTAVVVSLIDGSTLRGVSAFTWRWWVIRLDQPELLTPSGPQRADGHLVIRTSSVLTVQVTR